MNKRNSNDRSDRALCNAPTVTVLGLKPLSERLTPFAGIAADTAESNVLSCDDAGIVDDVLPRRPIAPCKRGRGKRSAAIDALPVTLKDLLLQPRWDIPAVHREWRLTFAMTRTSKRAKPRLRSVTVDRVVGRRFCDRGRGDEHDDRHS